MKKAKVTRIHQTLNSGYIYKVGVYVTISTNSFFLAF